MKRSTDGVADARPVSGNIKTSIVTKRQRSGSDSIEGLKCLF